MGQLIAFQSEEEQRNNRSNSHRWSKQNKIIIQKLTNMNKTNENEFCVNFVSNYLHDQPWPIKT
jgi:hypothetical protein